MPDKLGCAHGSGGPTISALDLHTGPEAGNVGGGPDVFGGNWSVLAILPFSCLCSASPDTGFGIAGWGDTPAFLRWGRAVEELGFLTLAARGDRAAQSAMVGVCLANQLHGIPTSEFSAAAEAFARLASSHGQAEDQLVLAGVLYLRAHCAAQRGDLALQAAYLFEASAIFDATSEWSDGEAVQFLAGMLTGLADQGVEDAAVRLNELMGKLSPAQAAAIRSTVTQQIEQAEALISEAKAFEEGARTA